MGTYLLFAIAVAQHLHVNDEGLIQTRWPYAQHKVSLLYTVSSLQSNFELHLISYVDSFTYVGIFKCGATETPW